MAEDAPPKPSQQHQDVGASTLANVSTWTWVSVPVTSIVTTTKRVTAPAAPTVGTRVFHRSPIEF